ncbi:MAG: Na+/H+ antiporter NhaC family protein [Treponema sp.]|nr:Na+/H+ antiporter NhaC family protein [Treponema sp.]
MIGTFWSLVPPIVAIALALLTKEVYSSLFVGIIIGGLFYAISTAAGFSGFVDHVLQNGLISSVSDAYNAGILVFLVVLGIMVALMNKAGGSAAFGEWAKKHIKTKVGAQIATIILGIAIFIDDYFNCLTVGSVMRPVTDRFKVSREKLAYLIDATAAPICIIAPVSSWAAAVAGFAGEGENGWALFCKAIPYNYYALLTIIAMFTLVFMKVDFGSMSKYEKALQMMSETSEETEERNGSSKGTVLDLIIPIVVLIVFCVLGMIYSGGFFTADAENSAYHNIIEAFSNADASVGLVIGSFGALIVTLILYLARRILTLKDMMECVPEGFKAMVPAILILSLAWTLKAMTDSLEAKAYVAGLITNAQGLKYFLPAIIFAIAVGLAFATGTSWGTFGILIPICIAAFPEVSDPIRIISISACMAGAVCGDHCSPISDTTIMASAGAKCDHVKHVSTQLPYALSVAVISFVCYIVAGFVHNFYIPLAVGIACVIGGLVVMKKKGVAVEA